MSKKLLPFTVVGYYEDNEQVFIDHVEAPDHKEAYLEAFADKSETLCFVACFPGYIEPVSTHKAVRR